MPAAVVSAILITGFPAKISRRRKKKVKGRESESKSQFHDLQHRPASVKGHMASRDALVAAMIALLTLNAAQDIPKAPEAVLFIGPHKCGEEPRPFLRAPTHLYLRLRLQLCLVCCRHCLVPTLAPTFAFCSNVGSTSIESATLAHPIISTSLVANDNFAVTTDLPGRFTTFKNHGGFGWCAI